MKSLLTLVPKHKILLLFAISTLIFITLLARNPFSDRTLIPNFEPYPDTIHYINPPLNLIHGNGFHIEREGREVKINVPPLYSVVQIPLFLIHDDPRMFYFTNVILAILSFFLFFKILQKITNNSWILGLTSFFYVTNYFFYWYPTLAMAENLTLTLFLLTFYILILPVTKKSTIIIGILSWCLYLTKYASIPLTITFLGLYILKIFISSHSHKSKLTFIPLLLIGAVFYLIFEQLTKGSTFITTTIYILSSFLKEVSPSQRIQSTNSTTWFSLNYISKNLPYYLQSLTGSSQGFLWDSTPIVARFIALPSLIGLVWALFKKEFRFMSISLIALLLSSILFMSTFYSYDMRYIYHAIPTLLIGFCLLLTLLFNFAKKNPLYVKLFYVFIAGIFLLYAGGNAIRLKKQTMLNLKYAETPWYYISVLELNKYFNTPAKGTKKPVVISALIPYFIDFYSNKNYRLLPLDKSQEFRDTKEATWGPNDYSDLIKLYTKYLKNGYQLFVHNYGLGNEADKHASYEKIKQTFKLTQVHYGCLGACNIYRVELKQ